jgi:4-hydroxybenzoate polyprenyltransferase
MSASTAWTTAPASTLLRLGRVSNLPTVWTNGLAATLIAGGDPLAARTFVVLLALSLLYLAGMYLNDAFDREIDARERPTRPIPAGLISVRAVYGAGFGMLAAGVVLLFLCGVAAGVAGLALAGAIVAYDMHHKGNPYSPVVMGLCRFLVYVAAGAAAGAHPASLPVLIGGAALFAHVVGLTYAAKQESLDRVDRLWPLAVLAIPLVLALPTAGTGLAPLLAFAALCLADLAAVSELKARAAPGAVPRAVGALIAAIALVDAVAVAPLSPAVALVCFGFYLLTRLAHRAIPGT